MSNLLRRRQTTDVQSGVSDDLTLSASHMRILHNNEKSNISELNYSTIA